MSGWKVTTIDLPEEINTYNKLEIFLNNKYTLRTEFFGENITLRPGMIQPLGKKFFGGELDLGLGDIYLVKVDKQFIGNTNHFRRRGTKDSWSMYTLPLKYLKNGHWNSKIPSNLKIKIKKILEEIYIASEFYADVSTSGGGFGRGNTYSGKTDGASGHVQVIPAENKVNIPDYTAYGIPKNTFTNSSYDTVPYYSFVKNSPIIKDLCASSKQNLVEVCDYLCTFKNHQSDEAYKLGQWFKLLDQGGFKYMVHKNYSGGIHVVEELQYCVIKIGTKPYYNKEQKAIKTGAAVHLPVCLLGLSDFEEVSIQGIKDKGVHFQLYSALKPGKAYILSRREPTGIVHYWTAPALIAGGFIYRPRSGTDCLNYGCGVVPFGTSFKEQQSQGILQCDEILPRCINCFTENSATVGFKCREHSHHFLCGAVDCLATRVNFATGRARGRGQMRSDSGKTYPPHMYVCPICRTQHADFEK
tara:strand:+ start:2169 stop:3581 length:1413 start_codon:yes stop_codon:yes gene_type:complete